MSKAADLSAEALVTQAEMAQLRAEFADDWPIIQEQATDLLRWRSLFCLFPTGFLAVAAGLGYFLIPRKSHSNPEKKGAKPESISSAASISMPRSFSGSRGNLWGEIANTVIRQLGAMAVSTTVRYIMHRVQSRDVQKMENRQPIRKGNVRRKPR